MRLQLIITMLFISFAIFGQNPQNVEADFLYNYYEQDGNHSAVTGGIGTEELNDNSAKLLLFVPKDSSRAMNYTFGYNQYTSASTDKIDAVVSSASKKDGRAYIAVGSIRNNFEKNQSISYGLSASVESDYFSRGATFGISKSFNKDLTTLDFNSSIYFDKWVVILPSELRLSTVNQNLTTDKRNTFNLSASISQLATPRLNFQIKAEMELQKGLLSTPFHRVYFENRFLPMVEHLPNSRIRLPIGLFVNYYVLQKVIAKSYYRYYTDTYGVISQTFNGELAIKITKSITASPSYRFYTQLGSSYFAEYKKHQFSDEFYTSDYDLSTFQSVRIGGSLKLKPFLNLRKANKRTFYLEKIELGFYNYVRSDGLTANYGSIGLSFNY
ncbi:MAG: hypothetical protein ACJAZ3_000659 [Sphingobacteriales bacterium]|jgi:hypothetical protein